MTKKPLSRKFAVALQLLSRAAAEMESKPEHFQQPIVSMYLLVLILDFAFLIRPSPSQSYWCVCPFYTSSLVKSWPIFCLAEDNGV